MLYWGGGGGWVFSLFLLLLRYVILHILRSLVVQYLLGDVLLCHGDSGQKVVVDSAVHGIIVSRDLDTSTPQSLYQLDNQLYFGDIFVILVFTYYRMCWGLIVSQLCPCDGSNPNMTGSSSFLALK